MLRARRFVSLFSVILSTLLLAHCGGGDSAKIEIRVVSDLVPELEVGTATAVLYEGVATATSAGLGSIERNVVSGEPLARGLWLATFERVPHGTYTVWTTLRRQNGEVLGRQPITFVVSADASYTVTITADCVGVECPGGGNAGFLACIAGVCVDPRCSQSTPEFCPSEEDLFCDAEDNDCVPQMPCGVATCEAGACLQVPSASECGDGEFCSALSGCTAEERPPEAPEDPPGPCGDACALLEQPCTYAFVVCENAAGCTPFANRPEGSPCPNEGVCNADGECIEGLRGDAGVVDAGVSDMDVAGDGGVLFDMSVTSDADVAFDMTTASDASALDASFDMSVAADTSVPFDMTTAIDTSVPVDMAADMGSTPCAAGYRGTVETGCVEINECAEELDTCDALTTCTNTAGSYTCSACPAGYVGAGRTGCTEINECLYNACDRRTTCTNTPGSYTCSACPSGFSGTGATGCDDINECDMDACDSLTECTNTVGSFACTACPEGYTGDGKTGCDDIDECALGIDTCSDVDDEFCMNGPGGYGCVKRRTTVAGGDSHTCALVDDGVQCWGANGSGQLGDGTTTQRNWPEWTEDLGGTAVSVTTGSNHACALRDDGNVVCWGGNWTGQLGDGTTTGRSLPARTLLSAPAVSVVSGPGASMSCAILENGSVECWGQNDPVGRFGPGLSDGLYASPVVVDFGGPAASVAITHTYACALLRDGRVRCYGGRDVAYSAIPVVGLAAPGEGPLALFADGSVGILSGANSTPADVGGARVARVFAGYYQACVLFENGSIRCRGYNAQGQLGDGTTTYRNTFVSPNTIGAEVHEVGAGWGHTCVRLVSGDVKCWGANWSGELGYRWLTPNALRPTATSPLGSSAVDISAGYLQTCAVLASGQVRCWGWNDYGQLGDGTLTTRRNPTRVIDLGGSAIDVSTGYNHSCAVLTDGSVRCWGSNEEGQLGIGSTSGPATRPTSVDLGGAIATSVGTGHSFSCVLTNDGSVKCWGANWGGEVGDGTTTRRTSPINVSLPRPATKLVVGPNHACVLLDDRSVRCWGFNYGGQIGDESTTNRPSPTAPSLGGAEVASLSAGRGTCAILVDGTVRCWGPSTVFGTNTTTPTAITVPGGATQIALTGWGATSCAIVADGSIKCWGAGNSGELGNGGTSSTWTPTSTSPIGIGATGIAAGASHFCTIVNDGSVYCWGSNDQGQLGFGTRGTVLLAPPEEVLEFAP